VLAAAVEHGDARAIWQWLGRFNQPVVSTDFPLVVEIMAEASRTPRIAEICRELDQRVLGSLSAALVAIAAPGTDRAAIDALAQFILACGVGVATRTVVHGPAASEMARSLMDRFLKAEMATLFRCCMPHGFGEGPTPAG
jgi:hypothetical protein